MNDYGRRMSMDSRMVREISRSPEMSAEQGSEWLGDWGGPSGYQFWARQPVNQRLTYFAIQDGYTTARDIADVTDLKQADVSRALVALDKRGIVALGVVEK